MYKTIGSVKIKKKYSTLICNGPEKASQSTTEYALHDRSASAASQRMALREGKEGYKLVHHDDALRSAATIFFSLNQS